MYAPQIIMYRLGGLLFSAQTDTWTLEKEFEQVLEDLEQHHDTMRVKDLTMCARTAILLLENMEFEKKILNDRQEQISSGFKEHIDSLVQTTNEFLTTIGVVAALILSIGIPWILTPLEQSTVLYGMPSSANTSDTTPDGNQGYSLAVANLIMVILMVVSVTASMLALVCSFGMYGTLNVSISEPLDRLWFLRMNKVSTCETYLVVSAASLCLSVPVGLYVVYGSVVTFASCAVIALAGIRYALFLLKFTSTTHARLLPKFKRQAAELRWRYQQHQASREDPAQPPSAPETARVAW
jgi:hypothetical protein